MIKVALTGGPSGGKSTLQEVISQEISSAYCVPEAATVLLSGGYPAPSEMYPWTEGWQSCFQLAVIAVQLSLESTASERAANGPHNLVIFDRGLPDAAAYLTGGMRELEEITSISEQQILERYDAVLHLPTTAVHGSYDRKSNLHRFEEAEQALVLESKIAEAWNNHPNRIVVDAQDKATRVAEALAVLRGLL